MPTDASAISCFPHFYDDTEHFAKLFDRIGRQLAFKGATRAAAAAWQKRLRAKLADVLGMGAHDKTRPRPRFRGREDMGSHSREDWTIHTEPDVIAPFYALVPKEIRKGERRPAVICPHGHGSAGRYSPAGRSDIPLVAGAIEKYHYDYAVKFAQRGFVALALDARGFGQRRIQEKQNDKQRPELFLASSCHELLIMAYPLGQTLAGMWTWDLMRLIDHLQTRPDVDPDRIGAAGLSGGGLQTLFLAALDRRVRAAVVSGYYFGVKDSLIRLAHHCECSCVPNLWKYADLGDIGGLVAPRGLFIETGDKDHLNSRAGSMDNVYSQVRYTRKAYKALGCPRQLVHHVFPGGHRWCGERAVPWLEGQLNLRKA